jgi:hypothetical protein
MKPFTGRWTPFMMTGRMQKILLDVALLQLYQKRDMWSMLVPHLRKTAAHYVAITAESQKNNKNINFTCTCNLTGAAQVNF